MGSNGRLLVKCSPAVAGQKIRLGAAGVGTLESVFTSIGHGETLGAAAPSTNWHLLHLDGADDVNAWEVCHSLVNNGMGMAGGEVEFAEPDLAQRFLTGDDASMALAIVAGCGDVHPQDPKFPQNADPYWTRDGAHGQFGQTDSQAIGPVRIAHLDTGFDPGHRSLPINLDRDRQRNFVEAGRPNDATDTTYSGALNNPGHGPGTLGLLAGRAVGSPHPLGGSPDAAVIPVRVADSVVLFLNSAIARAFDYVHGLNVAGQYPVDVITMSMGGIASRAWADAVNALYEQGVFVVTAAGNNFNNLPTRNIVYPARFGRVVAACGVMADGAAYADLGPGRMAGNYGPQSKMDSAISAFTPNTTWARRGCLDTIDLNGSGTSSATPQVAAAAALWIGRNRAALDAYPHPWMKVEAVRRALFGAAAAGDQARLGRGSLRAFDTLSQPPAPASELVATTKDTANFPLLSVLIGIDLGVTVPISRAVLELEALQLSQSAAIEAVLPDPNVDPATLSTGDLATIAEALMTRPGISRQLREALKQSSRAARPIHPVAITTTAQSAISEFQIAAAQNPKVKSPTRRRLRVFAFDPSLGTTPLLAKVNEATLDVRWEDLLPGPVGEYLEVVDIDPASRAAYAPVDLNHPSVLAQDGLSPSEGNPQFHQQMAYAVAMRTIEHFEHALGRSALWAPRRTGTGEETRQHYVQRLRIYPHALRAANAYYSPDRKALLLGYFTGELSRAGLGLPQGIYFASLSHDIIAHETTHALLDGVHGRFREPTNPDVLAFHEAFADIVALFQHFTMPEALRRVIGTSGGNLDQSTLLSQLAVEFGQARSGTTSALRDAIGADAEERSGGGPTRRMYDPALEAHTLGSVLVSAVFDAFLTIYGERARDLRRLATGGTGILPNGDIPHDLADRMAEEASKVAGQILRMCIRALDYCPPVDITFGEYLRALITADTDLVPDDPRHYRTAFTAAFRDRGIYPGGVRHLSPQNLTWDSIPLPLSNLDAILSEMDLSWSLTGDRRKAYELSRSNAWKFQRWLVNNVPDDQLEAFRLLRDSKEMTIGVITGHMGGMEVHSVRPARRIGPNGQSRTDLIVEITQTFRANDTPGIPYRGGSTLIIDLETHTVRYFVHKRINSAERLGAQRAYRNASAADPRIAYFGAAGSGAEPFAILHKGSW